MHFALWVYVLLFFTGLAAGVVDSIAGGGGLIALPMLLMIGLPAPIALATNKFQSLCGVTVAAWNYTRKGLVDLRACRLGIAATFIGAVIGVLTVQKTDTHLLGRIIPWLLAVILVYTVFRPKLGEQDQPPRMGRNAFFMTAGLGMGFYDGFFGPGAGSLWAIALVVGLGQNFTKATAFTKVMNLTSNVASVALFAWAGLINYPAAIAMGAGQVIGGHLGSGMVIKKGTHFIRPIFLTIVTLTLIRLVWVNYR
ncbi:MAG: TSUP family transporter [Opitutaceae bacterium]